MGLGLVFGLLSIDSTHNGIGDSRKLSLFLRHIRVTAPRLRLHRIAMAVRYAVSTNAVPVRVRDTNSAARYMILRYCCNCISLI